MRKKELEKCEQLRKDCFAYVNKQCLVLNDTEFNYKCPFYKTKKQAYQDAKTYNGILIDESNEIPFDDYIEEDYGYF